jgi:hypothetical protein
LKIEDFRLEAEAHYRGINGLVVAPLTIFKPPADSEKD